ncbi:MAG: hypothetical protein P0Y56_04425 [Candidatus Andeanibacterium colombiense]|uniref:Uncharacterized protein n=1 Tax=Candidatus Andeanibacterium colombiense TaxID=3121345 RepID=A0AAJ6BNM1_9SPHN|nr:MAG: hypothetical protein P0Y56_04425 [Sphingomonadaceae bacterium]
MAEKLNRTEVAARAIIHPEAAIAAPNARHAAVVDRSFELPGALYAATVGLFLAYLGVMCLGFGDPGLALPMAIFVLFIVAGFGLPALWVRMKPENAQHALSWGRFMREGIATETGRLEAKAAMVQVLILPALIFLWGVATVTIAAIVRG